MPGANGTVLDESAAIGTSLLNCDLVLGDWWPAAHWPIALSTYH